MRMDELKRGLWGYKKDGVYRYVVTLEEQATARVAEKEAKLEQQKAEHALRIAEMENQRVKQVTELETMVRALREENAALRREQAAVYATMMEAQRYAEQLKEESAGKKQRAQEKLDAAVQKQTRQLNEYQAQVQRLRSAIRETLVAFEGQIEAGEQSMSALENEAPSTDLDAAMAEEERPSELTVLPKSTPQGRSARAEESDERNWKKILFT